MSTNIKILFRLLLKENKTAKDERYIRELYRKTVGEIREESQKYVLKTELLEQMIAEMKESEIQAEVAEDIRPHKPDVQEAISQCIGKRLVEEPELLEEIEFKQFLIPEGELDEIEVEADGEEMTVKILNYNVNYWRDPSAFQKILEIDPDVISFQRYKKPDDSIEWKNFQKTYPNQISCSSRRGDILYPENSVFSKKEFKTEYIGKGLCTTVTKVDDLFYIVNVTLNSFHPKDRRRDMRMILDYIEQELPNEQVIIVGDFNSYQRPYSQQIGGGTPLVPLMPPFMQIANDPVNHPTEVTDLLQNLNWQSPCSSQSGGGDRTDFLYISPNWQHPIKDSFRKESLISFEIVKGSKVI